ncbi:MAG: thioesterase family protein [Pontixanthobacter sp.]
MKGYWNTADGVVVPEWIDRNGHMNMARYAAVFDRACDALLQRSGFASEDGDMTFVAGRLLMNHRRELMLGEEFVVWSGFSHVTADDVVMTHRLTVGQARRATCDIQGTAFSLAKRAKVTLDDRQIARLNTFGVAGLRNPFDRLDRS